MGHYHDVQKDLAGKGRRLREMIPEAYKGFSALHEATMDGGVLPRKIKEIIALSIAVAQQCDGCMVAHARSAAFHGATAEEVADGLSVNFMMMGGPGTTYAPRAFAAFEEFAEKYAAAGKGG